MFFTSVSAVAGVSEKNETFDFLLVRKLCKSRNHLIRNYPSTVKEIRFFTTINKGFRFPPFLIWLGTWLYWMMGNFFTQMPRYLSKKTIQSEEKVVNIEQAAGGFEYSDAYLHDNDARFVYGFIRSALNSGCIAANYLESTGSKVLGGQASYSFIVYNNARYSFRYVTYAHIYFWHVK